MNQIQIPLSKGYFAIVDEIDSDLLHLRWYWHRQNYAIYSTRSGNTFSKTRMHRMILERILDRPLSQIEFVDHINGNGLDNRRSNLRLATPSQNSRNSKKPITNTSGYKGVTFCKNTGKWVGQIKENNKNHYLGSYDTPEEAYKAYCIAARELHGDFANLG